MRRLLSIFIFKPYKTKTNTNKVSFSFLFPGHSLNVPIASNWHIWTVEQKKKKKKTWAKICVFQRAPCGFTDTEANLVKSQNNYPPTVFFCVNIFSFLPKSQKAPYKYTKRRDWFSEDPKLLPSLLFFFFFFSISIVICTPSMRFNNVHTSRYLCSDSLTVWPVGCGPYPLLEPTHRHEYMIESVDSQVKDFCTGKSFCSSWPMI